MLRPMLPALAAGLRWLWSWWSATGALWLLGILGQVWTARRGLGRLTRLADVAPATTLPPLTAVVAARNEADSVEEALRSLLAADYPELEVVAVDDRSGDGTGAILDRLAAEDPRLTVLHVRELPPGWLGKNHAMWLGAARARGAWLLFTDADVRFAPSALRRAVSFALREGLDHVTAAPGLLASGFWLRIFVAAFSLAFTVWQRPWHAPHPRRRTAVGVGAFNLVRAEAYRAVGGYASFPLAVADDFALGRRLKGAGYRQALVVACGVRRAPSRECGRLVELPWYPSLRAAVRGLEKNAFAMFEFRAPLVALWTAVGAAVALGPLVALSLAPGWHRVPWILSVLVASAAFRVAGSEILGRFPWPLPLMYPVAQLLLAWAVVRSAWLTLVRGGIRWRGTFYPLQELRGTQVSPLRRR